MAKSVKGCEKGWLWSNQHLGPYWPWSPQALAVVSESVSRKQETLATYPTWTHSQAGISQYHPRHHLRLWPAHSAKYQLSVASPQCFQLGQRKEVKNYHFIELPSLQRASVLARVWVEWFPFWWYNCLLQFFFFFHLHRPFDCVKPPSEKSRIKSGKYVVLEPDFFAVKS